MGRKKNFIKVNQPELSVVNTETGEIVKEGINKIIAVDLDSYIMIFLNSLSGLYNLDGLEIKVLMGCWKKSLFATEYEGNIVVNDVEFKQSIINDGLDLSPASIDVYISKLTKKEMLIRIAKGKYMLNPKYFWKGVVNSRSKLLFELRYEGE